MRAVIIHAGLNKTASSSIQGTCSNNAERLLRLGYSYPHFKVAERMLHNHSAAVYTLYSKQAAGYHLNLKWKVDLDSVRRDYAHQLDALMASDTPTKLISGEDISRLEVDELQSFRQKLESTGHSIRVIAYIRPPRSFLNSVVQEFVKNGGTIDGYSYHLNIVDRIENLKAAFDKVDFYSFQDACEHPLGPAGFFLEEIGITDLSGFQIEHYNKGLSDQSTRLISYINQTLPILVKDQLSPLRRLGDTNCLKNIPGPNFTLTQREESRFSEAIEDGNAYLRKNFGNRFCDEPISRSGGETYRQAIAWQELQLESLMLSMGELDNHLRYLVFNYLTNSIGLAAAQLCETLLIEPNNERENNAHLLRDAALKLESESPNLSYELMRLAHKLKPSGTLISKKLRLYEQNLGKGK